MVETWFGPKPPEVLWLDSEFKNSSFEVGWYNST